MNITSVEYWLDGMTSSYQVTKQEFYNSYNNCYSGFKLITYSDGTIKSFNKINL